MLNIFGILENVWLLCAKKIYYVKNNYILDPVFSFYFTLTTLFF